MKEMAANLSNEKVKGQIYTPEYIVNNLLDLAGYYSKSILKKHAIDNSCGDGAFLVTVVKRYCDEFIKCCDDFSLLAKEISTYIHGIEIDRNEYQKCIDNLNNVVAEYGICNINWDIQCADALAIDKYNGKMDYVLGNPPYVRVHNLGESFDCIKNFSFAKSGMTDLYIVFYEIGLRMLNANGVLGYITPSSFFNSIAGKQLRSYLVSNNLIDKIVDLKHFQAFVATTYTTIMILKNNRIQNTIDYYEFDEKNKFPYYVDTLDIKDYIICNNFYFAKKEKLKKLRNILSFKSNKEHFSVKNGFATLADDFFIGEFDFDEFTIPIVKASTGKLSRCIFPYDGGKIIPYEKLTGNPAVKSYYEANKETLLKRSLEKNGNWYAFGRSQGINDVYRIKYAINSLIRAQEDIKLIKCDKGVGVYSGLYILTDVEESVLRSMLYCDEFVSYISLLGKYKSGGYYTFSSKDLKNYLEYKYSQQKEFKGVRYEQFTIFSNT